MGETKKASEEEISVRAYELFIRRDGSEGNAVEDWLRAENELNQNAGQKSGSEVTMAKPFTDTEKANIREGQGMTSS